MAFGGLDSTLVWWAYTQNEFGPHVIFCVWILASIDVLTMNNMKLDDGGDVNNIEHEWGDKTNTIWEMSKGNVYHVRVSSILHRIFN